MDYKVGIQILMENKVSAVLATIAKDVLGLEGGVKRLEKSFEALGGRMKLIGALSIGAGIGMLDIAKHVEKHGENLAHFQAQLGAALPDATRHQKVAEATAAAWKEAGRNLNTDVADNLMNIHHLMNITGNLDEAMRLLPAFTGAQSALKSLKEGNSHLQGDRQTYDFARSLELLGVTQDEEKLKEYSSALTRSMVGMRGLVDGSKLFQGVQNAGGARYGWDLEFVSKYLPALLQASPRAGAGLYQLDRSYGAGVSTLAMAQGAEKYGLWKKEDEIWSGTHFKGMQTGSIAGYDLMRSDPKRWAEEIVLPLLKARGIDTDDTNQMAKAVTEISRGNKNLGVILDEVLLPAARKQLNKEGLNISNVPDDAVGIMQANDPKLIRAALGTQWENLLTSLGRSLVDPMMDTLKRLTNGIRDAAQWFVAHPDVAKAITATFVGLAAGLTALGAVLLGSALVAAIGAGGWLIAGVAALGAAFAAFSWLRGWKTDEKHNEQGRGWNGPAQKPSLLGDMFRQPKEALELIAAGVRRGMEAFRSLSEDVSRVFDPGRWTALGARLAGEFTAMWNEIVGAIQAGVGMLRDALMAIPNAITAAWNAVKGAVGSFHNPLSNPGNVPPQGSPMGFKAPPQAPVHVTTEANLHVGGRQFAKATAQSIGRYSTQVASGANYDDRRHMASVDQWAYKTA